MNYPMNKKMKTLLVSFITLSMLFMMISPSFVYAENETVVDENVVVDEEVNEEVNEEDENVVVDEEANEEANEEDEEVNEEDEEVNEEDEEVNEEDEEVNEEDEEVNEEDEEVNEEDEEVNEEDDKKLFADVQENHWAFNVIHELRDKNIVKGISETEFAPAKLMTRAEFVTLLVNSLELEAVEKSKFTDVAENAWYANTVQAAYEAGIVKGMSETTFAPNKSITREEIATMILKAYELKQGQAVEESSEAAFIDEDQISGWAKENINKVVALGLMMGRAVDQFAPQGITTRAEGAQVIYNLLNK